MEGPVFGRWEDSEDGSSEEYRDGESEGFENGASMSRELAKHYVAQLLARGYTAEDAQAQAHTGVWNPDGTGYNLSHGKIECPPFSRQFFSFEELAEECARGW